MLEEEFLATVTTPNHPIEGKIERRQRIRTNLGVLRYLAIKLVTLFMMVVVSVLLIILIGNFGGYIDKMVMGEIDLQVGLASRGLYTDLPAEQRMELIEDYRQQMYDAAGLNEPFLNRTLRWMWMAIRLDFGHPLEGSPFFPNLNQSVTISQMLLAALPATLSLFGLSNLVIFITSVVIGLLASQRYESLLDKFIKKIAPVSAIPAWFYGVILAILLFRIGFLLPDWLIMFFALFLGAFFQSAYTWRSFFIIYSNEDYLEYAKAQGIPRGKLLRKYLVQPSLPTILTTFSLSMIGVWMGSIIMEPIFNWPGIGNLFLYATRFNDTSILVSVVVVYAYLLAFTIFSLEIVFLLVDPRLRIRNGDQSIARRRRKFRLNFTRRKHPRGSRDKFQIAQVSQRIIAEGNLFISRLVRFFQRFRNFLADLRLHPPVRRSLIFIAAVFGAALIIVIAIPYQEAIHQWRGDGNIFIYQPEGALPESANWFSEEKLPENIILKTTQGQGEKIESFSPKGNKDIWIAFPFDYPYDALPQDISLIFDGSFTKNPLYILYWVTPDGERTKLEDLTVKSKAYLRLSQSEEIQKNLGAKDVNEWLFMGWAGEDEIVKGTYRLEIEAFFFEPDAELDVELVMRGEVYGIFGTDSYRRDIRIELLWGLPIVLAFGVLGAVITNILSMTIAAASAWYGGWLDNLIQRVTELNMALPAFPISLLIFTMYSKSIWMILLVTVTLSIFGSGLKSYRSTFLEVREAAYIEAAIAYGAKDGRLIFRYMVPRIVSILIPRIVVDFPSFVFLEAALAFLGLSDPVFPTWGKMILGSIFNLRGTSYSFSPENMMRYTQFYFSILIPALVLIFLAISFNTLGGYLEKYLNPKLRDS